MSRMVCIAFHGAPPSDTHQAAHKDGSTDNNTPDNLYWATPSENNRDQRRHGTLPRGEQAPGAKLTEQDVLEIRALHAAEAMSKKGMGLYYGVGVGTVEKVAKRKTWGHVPPRPVPHDHVLAHAHPAGPPYPRFCGPHTSPCPPRPSDT